ncbi:MAG: TSUP family transporter [Bacteroidetes bacterium]|jgi:uncharacterized membrane protein YfcA|nr:TSUP family transporter [Bacteroidota bacterium]
MVGYELTLTGWIIVALCALFTGMAKTGLSGAGLLVVPLMAYVFGGKPSVGLLLPLLIFADVFAVSYYNRHAQWKYVIKLMPWTVAGVLIGMFVGKHINEQQFNNLLGTVVVSGIILIVWFDFNRHKINIPDYWWFSATMGLLGGFTTMIGNAAGPVMTLYLLSMRLPKNNYIGTAAWFFFIINVFKVPLHVFVWNTITWQSFLFDVFLIVPIMLGALIGVRVVKLFPEKGYRIFLILSTIAAAIVLLMK